MRYQGSKCFEAMKHWITENCLHYPDMVLFALHSFGLPHVPKPDAFPWGWPLTLHAWGVLVPWYFHLVILHITNRDKKVCIHIFLQGFIILLIFFFSVSETFSFKTKGTVCEFSNIKKKWMPTPETSRSKLSYP